MWWEWFKPQKTSPLRGREPQTASPPSSSRESPLFLQNLMIKYRKENVVCDVIQIKFKHSQAEGRAARADKLVKGCSALGKPEASLLLIQD